MSTRRVVVTGMGLLSAIGKNLEEHWDSLLACRSGIAELTCVDRELISFPNGAEIKDYDPAVMLDQRSEREQDLFTQYALIAASEAIRDSGLEWSDEDRARTAVTTGSGGGGQDTIARNYKRLFVEGKRRFHPHTVPHVMANAGASAISMKFGFSGPCYTMSTACSSSSHAIGSAFWNVRNGAADIAVTGGSEALFNVGMLKAWEAIRVVSPETCRPFSLGRPGMILGDGAGMLVLETLENAKKRGARIYAELAGFGMSSDASHLTKPTLEGPTNAMRGALRDASLDPASVGYINAHGTGTAANDANECAVVQEVFGEHAASIAMSSTKSMHGHALGAAGALEAVATVMAVANGVAPPTANFEEPDPECPLDCVPNEARACEISAALSNSFAFGGLNAVLAFRRFSD